MDFSEYRPKFERMGIFDGQMRNSNGQIDSGHAYPCKKAAHNATIYNKDKVPFVRGDLCSCDLQIIAEEVDLKEEVFYIVREAEERAIQYWEEKRRAELLLQRCSIVIFQGDVYYVRDLGESFAGNLFKNLGDLETFPELVFIPREIVLLDDPRMLEIHLVMDS